VNATAALRRSVVLACVLAVAACAVPVSAHRVGSEDVYATLHENVLSGAAPSVAARLTI
jgi:hypothetical protein